ILAKCVRDIPRLEQAFATYAGLRRARVERTVKWARSLGGLKVASNPVQVWFRDLMMPVFLKLFANPAALDWIYDYKVDWEAPVSDQARKQGLDLTPTHGPAR
ncbi:MAG TPA: hypothetical protein VFO07_17965, partial [Roseiflexaceae bacterium]|nr:hypothetical protein [Roseiflexaceae bacterium]